MGSKGEIVGDLPEKHVEIDNMNSAFASIKSSIDKKEGQKVFSAISNIIKQYKEDFNKELTDRNKHLVRYIYQNEKQFLESFINNEDNFSDLKKKIQDKINKEISKGDDEISEKTALDEISEAVRKALIAYIKEKESKSATTSQKTWFTKKQLTEFAKEAFKSELIKDAKTLLVDDFRKNYAEKSRKIYVARLNEFKEKLGNIQKPPKKSSGQKLGAAQNSSGKSKTRQRKTKKQSPRKRNLLEKNLNGGILDTSLQSHERAIGRKLSNKIIRTFVDIRKILSKSFVLDRIFGTALKVGKFVGSIGGAIGKILGKTLKFVMKGVLWSFNGVFKTLGWIKNNIFMKLFGFIGNLFTGIVKSPITKMFFSILFTPPGMFALGYFSAWIWSKIKKLIPNVKDWFGDKSDDSKDLIGWIMDTLSSVTKTIGRIVKDISEKIGNITESLGEFIKSGSNIVAKVFDFISPGLFGFLVGGLLRTLINVRANPLFKAIKHLKGMPFLVGLGAVLLINALTAVFKSRNKTGVEYVKEGIKDYAMIAERQSDANKQAISLLDEPDNSKFHELVQRMDNEVAEIQDLNNSIELIWNTDLGGSKLSDSKNKTNLYDHFPGLFTSVYSSSVFGNDVVPFEVAHKSRSKRQLKLLSKHLKKRIDKLFMLKNMLYSIRSVPDMEKMLSNFKFETTKTDNGHVEHDFIGLTDEFGKQFEAHANMIGEKVTIKYNADDPSKRKTTPEVKHISNARMESNYLLDSVLGGQRWHTKERKVPSGYGHGTTVTLPPSLDYRFVSGTPFDIFGPIGDQTTQSLRKTNQNAFSMMGSTDVIRFTKANDVEQKRMIEEFNQKYEERKSSRKTNRKKELQDQIKELQERIDAKRMTNGKFMESLKEIKENTKKFANGARNGARAASFLTKTGN